MLRYDYSVTFACYNQIAYTRLCIDSLVQSGIDLGRVVAVDNGSTDGTIDYLHSLPLGGVICNKRNLGCGVAWNQGALLQQAEWTIVMNNDIICSKGWLEGLIDSAEKNRIKIASPGMIEGDLDYDFESFTYDAAGRLKNAARVGLPHAVCMAIHESVWMDVGYFMSIPKLFGYEDGIFFSHARRAGIRMGTVGSSWIHHFGSVTQKAMALEKKISSGLGDHGLYKSVLGESWLCRKTSKLAVNRNREKVRQSELAAHGITMYGIRKNGVFEWR
jgi:GT2 family glycosyltransferase